MLPIGTGIGQISHGDQYLCKVTYTISPCLGFITVADVQHVSLEIHDYECEHLLKCAGLTLLLVNGMRCRLPRVVRLVRLPHLECFLESDEVIVHPCPVA